MQPELKTIALRFSYIWEEVLFYREKRIDFRANQSIICYLGVLGRCCIQESHYVKWR